MKALLKLLLIPFQSRERARIKKLLIAQRIKEIDENLTILREENNRLRIEIGLSPRVA